ncbi:MAG: hypothetical protein JNL44_19050, partial [Gemmatimonadetes bacterium]|nr:hypothetical protein [Gemmatimonadota bacterium]
GHLNGPPGAISAIARWDGSAWQPMGAGFNDSVLALQVVGNQLFAGGFFSASGALPLSRVAVWDGGKWANVGGGVTAGQAFPSVNALANYNGHLIAGGFFSAAGGAPASHIARWDGQQWHALGAGVAPSVMALGTFAGDLIAAGSFDTAGGAPASRIARWDGLAWSPIGGGMNQSVAALT